MSKTIGMTYQEHVQVSNRERAAGVALHYPRPSHRQKPYPLSHAMTGAKCPVCDEPIATGSLAVECSASCGNWYEHQECFGKLPTADKMENLRRKNGADRKAMMLAAASHASLATEAEALRGIGIDI